MQQRSYTKVSVEDYQAVRRNEKKVYRRKKRQYYDKEV
jgi:hypothetical protein